jgi:gliding motility-associated-like protein
MKFRVHILAFLLMLTGLSITKGSHIIGGDLTYRRLSGNDFEVTLKIYRDWLGLAPLDANITFGIFVQNSHLLIDSTLTPLDTSYLVPLSMPGTTCAPPPNVIVEAGVYIDTVSLANEPNGYYISWQRCCRNGGIVNINNGTDTGIAFYAEVPDPALVNSSPEFDFEPLPYVCEEQPFVLDYSATDPDGDVLVYSLAEPLAGTLGWPVTISPSPVLTAQVPGPYPNVDWNPGYGLSNMFGSPIPVTVDNNTGLMSARIDLSGLYAVAVEVREFRNGVQIGMIRREIEIASVICLNNAPELSPSVTPVTYEIIETDTLCRTFTWIDLDNDSIHLSVSGNVLGGAGSVPPYGTATVDSADALVNSDFCWITECGQGRNDPYYLVFKAVDNGCPLPFTTIDSIRINVLPMPEFGPANILCANLVSDDVLKLVWVDSTIVPQYFEKFEIYRSVNGGTFSVIATISNDTVRSFSDINAIDNHLNDYCYYIKSVNKCGVTGPASDTLCSVSQVNGKTNYIQWATVLSDGKVELKWDPFPDGPFSTYYFFGKENGVASGYSQITSLQYPLVDSLVLSGVPTSAASYCYYMQNADWCGNLSPPSNIACTIHLEGQSKPLVNELSWNEYVNWAGGVQVYDLEIDRGVTGVYEPLSVKSPVVTDHLHELPDPAFGIFSYRVTATEGQSGRDAISRSNEVILEQVPFVFIPNAFTPNGDGVNDLWHVSSNYVSSGELTIYNRWGQMVFTGSLTNDWDGSFEGNEVPSGVYVYHIRYSGFGNATEETAHGLIHLVR